MNFLSTGSVLGEMQRMSRWVAVTFSASYCIFHSSVAVYPILYVRSATLGWDLRGFLWVRMLFLSILFLRRLYESWEHLSNAKVIVDKVVFVTRFYVL